MNRQRWDPRRALLVFLVRNGSLIYLGSLGPRGTFVDTAKPITAAQGVTKEALLRMLDQLR